MAVVTVLNQGNQRGIFTVHVQGEYLGGGLVEHGTDQLPVGPLDKATTRVRFVPNDGMTAVQCFVEAPMVDGP